MKTNTELCIDLKTKLQNDVLMKPGKDYPGILRRNNPNEEFGLDDNSYTFVETIPFSFVSSIYLRYINFVNHLLHCSLGLFRQSRLISA
jgi:hypothetical protein